MCNTNGCFCGFVTTCLRNGYDANDHTKSNGCQRFQGFHFELDFFVVCKLNLIKPNSACCSLCYFFSYLGTNRLSGNDHSKWKTRSVLQNWITFFFYTLVFLIPLKVTLTWRHPTRPYPPAHNRYNKTVVSRTRTNSIPTSAWVHLVSRRASASIWRW